MVFLWFVDVVTPICIKFSSNDYDEVYFDGSDDKEMEVCEDIMCYSKYTLLKLYIMCYSK